MDIILLFCWINFFFPDLGMREVLEILDIPVLNLKIAIYATGVFI